MFGAALANTLKGQTPEAPATAQHNHAMGLVGRVRNQQFAPSACLRAWNFSDQSPEKRAKYYREDPTYLLEMPAFVDHYEVAWHDLALD